MSANCQSITEHEFLSKMLLMLRADSPEEGIRILEYAIKTLAVNVDKRFLTCPRENAKGVAQLWIPIKDSKLFPEDAVMEALKGRVAAMRITAMEEIA